MADSKAEVVSDLGGYHSYSTEERASFTALVNLHLGGDPELVGALPLDPDSDALFAAVGNGVLFCKLINVAVPGTIYEYAINTKNNLNVFQVKENLNLAINAAKAIGCTVINIVPEAIIQRKEYLILGLLWQIIKILMLSTVNLKVHPELSTLVQQHEALTDLLKLPPETLLLRWFNHHLSNARHHRRVANFSSDVQDAECYAILLHQIDPACCSADPVRIEDHTQRAAAVIGNAQALGVRTSIRPHDITNGNPRVNLIFAAAVFNTKPGLQVPEQALYEASGLLDDDTEGPREERTFRMWINSLNLEDLYVNNLYEDVKDGLTLLKVLECIHPGIVEWKKVEKNPNHRIKRIANGNLVVQLGKQLGFSLVGIGGMDVADGNRKLTLAYVWQLMRSATLKLVSNLTEENMLKSANERVTSAARSFRDPTLSSGRFLLELFATVEPRAVDWGLATPGESPAEKTMNAKYVLSVARKLGAGVFCVWEDIVEVRPKMVMTLVATALNLAATYCADT